MNKLLENAELIYKHKTCALVIRCRECPLQAYYNINCGERPWTEDLKIIKLFLAVYKEEEYNESQT